MLTGSDDEILDVEEHLRFVPGSKFDERCAIMPGLRAATEYMHQTSRLSRTPADGRGLSQYARCMRVAYHVMSKQMEAKYQPGYIHVSVRSTCWLFQSHANRPSLIRKARMPAH